MYKSPDELKKDIAVYTEQLDEKFNGKDGKRYVMLCGGTGCMAANSMGLKEKLEEYINKYGIADKVGIRTVGCFGMCSQGLLSFGLYRSSNLSAAFKEAKEILADFTESK